MARPILWSFRRCPYAMRARLAIASAGLMVELREVVLRDKPQAFLDTSPSATVPCLKDGPDILDESLDIMIRVLSEHDPQGWLEMPDEGHDLIDQCDGPFKTALDRYKYSSRHPNVDRTTARDLAGEFVRGLDDLVERRDWLFGSRCTLADMAILPFIRQFAHVDLDWFDAQPWPGVIRWLSKFKTSDRYAAVMARYPQWQPGEVPVMFPEKAELVLQPEG